MDENYNGMNQQPGDDGAQPTQKRPPVPEELGGTRVAPQASEAAPSASGAPSSKESRRHHPGVKAVLLGVAGGVVGAAALTGVLLGTGVIGRTTATLTTGSNQPITINPSDNDTSTATAVAAKSLPSVVTVSCTYDSGEGLGSGVVLDTEGNIITNNHVIENADSITVTINGKSYDAELVGTDTSSDLAVVKADLQGDSVTPIEVGDSSALQVGDWVMSVGSPFGLEQSVSQGIVSALTRNELMQSSSGNTLYTNLIQVDAAINPGNSGGPTFNAAGQVIGINSSIASTAASSDSAGSIGIGFAIPSNLVKRVADEIIKDGKVKHVALGVVIKSDTVEADGVTRGGATITKSSATGSAVVSGGPADKAGLKEGDTIVAFNGNAVNNNYSLLGYVRAAAFGDKVTLTIVRDGKTMDVDVTLDQEESSVNGSSSSDSNGNSQNKQNNQNGNGQNGYGNGNGNGNSDGGTGDGGGFSDPFGLW